MTFELMTTDIVNIQADAIVLPANSKLREGSGASTAIFKAAGRKKLTQECKKIGSCDVGSAVPTLAYDLDAKYIIHAVVPKWIDGQNGEYELLSSAYLSSLNVADIMGCTSIAFPLLASGNNGYDLDVAFQIATESIQSFEGQNLEKVILVLFDTQATFIAKARGYEVLENPVDIHKRELRKEHIEKNKQMKEDGKEIAQTFLEDQIQKALDYLQDKKNREKVLETGIWIAKKAIEIVNGLKG